MKIKKNITQLSILAIIFIVIACGYCTYQYNRIDLGRLTWVKCGANCTALYDNNKEIIKGECIELWADYPYLFGQICISSNSQWFIYDLNFKSLRQGDSFYELQKSLKFPAKSGESKLNFSTEIGKNHYQSILVTFETLKGQWADAEKLKQLKEKLKK